jgi:hypothetical protein
LIITGMVVNMGKSKLSTTGQIEARLGAREQMTFAAHAGDTVWHLSGDIGWASRNSHCDVDCGDQRMSACRRRNRRTLRPPRVGCWPTRTAGDRQPRSCNLTAVLRALVGDSLRCTAEIRCAQFLTFRPSGGFQESCPAERDCGLTLNSPIQLAELPRLQSFGFWPVTSPEG